MSFFDDPDDGALPSILLVLTMLTGVIDAVSILRLGRVFVANMTGNVVFVGFAAAGAPGFVLSASLFALGGFLVGAASGGRLASRHGADRAVLTRTAALVEGGLVGVGLVVAVVAGPRLSEPAIDAVAALSALAMGTQNAVVRRLGVADLTTTVLTMTLTGIAADSGTASGRSTRRRILAVVTMLGGAVSGAELVLHEGVVAGLSLAEALLVVAAAMAVAAVRRPGAWRGH